MISSRTTKNLDPETLEAVLDPDPYPDLVPLAVYLTVLSTALHLTPAPLRRRRLRGSMICMEINMWLRRRFLLKVVVRLP
jgi:hypothetical protein